MNVGILEFIRQPWDTAWSYVEDFTLYKQFAGVVPQTISYWSRKFGHKTYYSTYFGWGDPLSKLPNDLDIIFVSVHTPVAPLAYAISRVLKLNGVITVIGGPHAMSFPEDCSRFFDIVVGHCNESLIKAILDGEIEKNSTVESSPFAEIPTIQERLPEIKIASFVRGRPYYGSVVQLMASRGCPHSCTFCSDWNTNYFSFSEKRVEEDLFFVSQNYPGIMLGFYDPNFAVQFDKTMSIIERIPPSSRNPFMVQSSLAVLQQDRLNRLKAANCQYVAPGIESWTKSYSAKLAKRNSEGGEKFDYVISHFTEIQKKIPYVVANFILGLDEDSGDEPFILTEEFIRFLPSIWTSLAMPLPFGGTPMYSQMRKEGRVLEKLPFCFYNHPYLAYIPKNYDPLEYLKRFVSLYSRMASLKTLARRIRTGSIKVRFGHIFRGSTARYRSNGLNYLLKNLSNSKDMQSFHTGESKEIPCFYHEAYKKIMGKYENILPINESIPNHGKGRNLLNRGKVNKSVIKA